MNLRDTLERLLWTFVAGFLGSLMATPIAVDVLLDGASLPALDLVAVTALFAGLTSAANYLLLVARWRLSVLPNPGSGLPGLPTPPADRPHAD